MDFSLLKLKEVFDAQVAYFESWCMNTLRSQGNVSGIEPFLDILLGK